MKDYNRFRNPDQRPQDAVALLVDELKEKGVEVTMCIRCGELMVKLTKSQREILEHKCQQ